MRFEISCSIIFFGFSYLFLLVQSKHIQSILHAQEGKNTWLQAFIPSNSGNGKARGLGVGVSTKLELVRGNKDQNTIRCSGKHLTSLSAIFCSSIDECIPQIPCLAKQSLLNCDGQLYEGTSNVGENGGDEYQWKIPKNFPSPGHGMVACKSVDTSHPYQKKFITTLDIFFLDNHDEIKLASTLSEKDLTAIEVQNEVNGGESANSFSAGEKINLLFWTAPFFLQNYNNSTQQQQLDIKWIHKNGSHISIDSNSSQINAVKNTYALNDLTVPKNIQGITLSVPWRSELAQKKGEGINNKLLHHTLELNVSSSNEEEQEQDIPTTTDSSITTTSLPVYEEETVTLDEQEMMILEE